MIPRAHAALYRRYRVLAQALDAAVRVPGTRIGLGLDALLGLVPGVGDLATGALGAYGLWVAQRMGAPRALLLRMAGNLAIDTIAGSVPVLGDLFDLGFKANLRNLALLDRWLEAPLRTQRTSTLFVGTLGLTLAALVVAVVYAAVTLAAWAWSVLRATG